MQILTRVNNIISLYSNEKLHILFQVSERLVFSKTESLSLEESMKSQSKCHTKIVRLEDMITEWEGIEVGATE
jgi:hypothetical protein